MALSLAMVSIAQGAAAPDDAALQAARINNIGTALMGQQMLEPAAQKFAKAYALDPRLVAAQLNEGIALMYLQKNPQAEADLRQAAAKSPRDPHVWYVLGLLYRSDGHSKQASDAFSKVVALDPLNADSHYFLGLLDLQNSQYSAALSEFRDALRLNPFHASAEFGLARALVREGHTKEARVAFARFQHLTQSGLGSPLAESYGEQGELGHVEDAVDTTARTGPMIPVSFTLGWESAGAPGGAHAVALPSGGARACLIRMHGMNPNEAPILVVPARGAYPARFYRDTSESGKVSFEEIPAAKLGIHADGPGVSCAVGDYDNDGLPDLALATTDRVLLYRNMGNGMFEDVSKAAGLKPLNHPAGLAFVDYDHDGDLDLLVTGSPVDGGDPNVLYRNNGNKTFTVVTGETGLGGAANTRTFASIPSDLNNDRAIDLLVGGTVPTVYTNPREGAFSASPLYSGSDIAPATSIAIFDFNKDGWMDVAVTHAGAPGISLWRNVDGKRFVRVSLPVGPDVRSATSIVPIDFDNDGWIDLVALVRTSHGSRLLALRNLGPAAFKNVTSELGLNHLKLGDATTLLAADVNGDGAADLILTGPSGSVRVLRNVGGNRNHSLRIALKGVADNRSGIGTKVEVFANGLWQKWEDTGQPEIIAGTGQATSATLVRLLWPTGVPQDEINIAAGKPVLLTETDRRGSSCPTLFAWNGARYVFVNDVIGAGVVGHWVSPKAHDTPDPGEWIKIEGSQMKARNGFFSLRFGEPMEETNYIDQVRLMAIDHPAGTQVNPQEAFLTGPPFESGKIVFSRAVQPLQGAWDDHGRNVLPLLRTIDHRYVRDFTNLDYAGFARLHTLTLDLGPVAARSHQPLRLLLHGFVDYFSATSMFAAWQAGIKPIPPYVQAQLPDGSWRRIVNDMGFPAGLPRTIVVNLTGKLPANSTRIRIVTNLQIYWDQILVDTTPPAAAKVVRITSLPLARADLAFRGYPQQIDGKMPGDLTYNYNRISRTGPFIPERGDYTRYGVVTPLLRHIDNRFVIFGTGEDMDLEFSGTPLPPLPVGWVRDYFFYANGFVKDMDFYEAEPYTVGELPFHSMSSYPYPEAEHYPADAAHLAYRLEWNTRFKSGAVSSNYQFQYTPHREVPETSPAEGSASGATAKSAIRSSAPSSGSRSRAAAHF